MLEVIRDGNTQFIRWAMNAVLHWSNEVVPDCLYHIHGSQDEVFPLKYCSPNAIIKGGHMIVMTSPYEINEYIASVLNY
jgi:hypothetical protein